MALEFESLVGYLYVVGGRAISTAPPGTLCTAAPAHAARGREADTFFALVTPSGDAVAPADFYQRLATLASERYFASTGSVTAGLRDLFLKVNQNLYDYNQKKPEKPYEANMICAVLRGVDLIVARCGASVCVLRDNGRTRTFPEDWRDDDALYTAPLGVQPAPDVRLTQYRLHNGSRIAFGDANLADLTLGRIDNALVSVDVATALVGFKELAKLQLSLMIAEFVPPNTPTPPSVPIAESTAHVIGGAKRDPTPPDDPLKAAPKPARKRERGVSPLTVLWRHTKRWSGITLLQIGKMIGVFGKMIDHYFGPDKEGQRRWLRSPIGVGTVVMFPAFVVMMVLVLWLSGTDESQFELCLQELNNRHELAKSPATVNSDRQRILEVWGFVQDKVEECNAMRPNDLQVAAIRTEGQQITDRLQDITRVEPIVIQSIPASELTRVVAQGRNVFALDAANNQVYQIILSEDGLSATTGFYPIREMRQGVVVSGFEVGEIFDIAFSPTADRLFALATNGILVQCEVRFWDCRAERLSGVEQWRRPVAFTFWIGNGNLYLLDAEAQNGQIWRYEPSGGVYGARGMGEYFSGSTRPNLRNPVDLQIDRDGNIYILQADGTITKHRGGSRVDFRYTSLPETQSLTAAVALFVDDTTTAQGTYIVSQNARTIFETSLAGNWRRSFRTVDESWFDLVSDVVVITDQNRRETMYVVSGNTVFAIVKNDG